MQYPSGISFQVIKDRLSRSNLPYKLSFKEGIYTVLNIRKNLDKIVYTFLYNNTSKISLSCNNCFEIDKIIAFCRNEPFKEVRYDDLAGDSSN